MSRNHSVIRSKLLDAFSPTLTFQPSALPFKKKENQQATKNPSQATLSRQCYINLQENLQDDSVKSSQVTAQTFSGNDVKSNRKYLRVMSNPHEARESITKNSNMQKNVMKNLCVLGNLKPELMSSSAGHSTAKSVRHHQSCLNLQSALSNNRLRGPNTLLSTPIHQNQSTKLLLLPQTSFALGHNENDSVQFSEHSKINILQNLIGEETDSNNQLVKDFSINSIFTDNATAQVVNRAVERSHSTSFANQPKNQSSYPLKIGQSSLMCFPLNNGQPAFRTIVKKDLKNPEAASTFPIRATCNRVNTGKGLNLLRGDLQQNRQDCPSQKHQSTQFDKVAERYSKCKGKQNQFVIFDTMNLRSQVAQQILQ